MQLSQQLVCVVGASDGLWRERQEPQGPGCRLRLRALILRVFESLWGILENFCLNLGLGLNMGRIVREQLLGSVGPSPSPSWPKGDHVVLGMDPRVSRHFQFLTHLPT